ncbi:Rft protein-domain-containing protein [Neurospora tetraspora]|uniref:Man(5)GlcNAc(2)-PP-dolichol translocation protein RFT1 n=1 Tax=Neurospora tetraspora TaxID=94610 RepID=A0AAE0JIF7_9PEZI|nr:Rft protein-domain-containing protein [Neurospora tetraspora]
MADLKEPPPPTTTTRALRGASLLILLQILSRALTFIANQILLRFLTASLLGVSTQLEVYYLSVIFFARESLRVAIQRQDTVALSASLSSTPSDETATTPSGTAKDGKDGAAGRDGSDGSANAKATQAVINLSHLSLALSLPLSFLFGHLYLSSLSPLTIASTPFLVPSLYLYGLAAILELLSEPCFAVMQIRFQFGTRAAAESVATFLRCAVTLGTAVWGAMVAQKEMGTLPFAVGQVTYAVGLLGVYLWKGWGLGRREGFSLLPRLLSGGEKKQRELEKEKRTGDGKEEETMKGKGKGGGGGKKDDFVLGYFYRPTLDLASSMMAQSVVKHILTQGDTFLVSILSTPTAQGVYALANNYGGLLARLVFQPVEESSRSYFSRLLADSTTTPPSSTTPATSSTSSPTSPTSSSSTTSPSTTSPSTSSSPKHPSPSQQALSQASTALTTLLHSYLLFSLPLLVFGPPASSPLLTLIAGRRWTSSTSSPSSPSSPTSPTTTDSAPATLALYMYYIPLLALNGILEAFVSSVASESQVHRQSLFMTAFSLVFAGTGYLTLKVWGMGARGLVLANAVNMVCRIGWCWGFVSKWIKERSLRDGTGKGDEGKDGAGGKEDGENVRFGVLEVLPKPGAVAAAVVARSVVGRVVGGSQEVIGAKEAVWELLKIAGVAVPFVVAVAIAEREFLLSGYRALQGKRQQQKS